MKNKFKYFKKLLKVLIWPIVLAIGSYFINFIFICIFNTKEKGTMENNEFIKYMDSLDYQDKLSNYISNKSLIIVLIMLMIFLPIFFKLIKKYRKENTFKIKNIFLPVILGIVISLIYNIFLFSLNNKFHFTKSFELSSIPILIQIISSGIIGPILEELLFRGIVYNKLKEFNKLKIAIILCSIIFSLMHSNIIDMIYAFCVSFMLIHLYEKYKTLKAPILMHMSLNITIILLFSSIIKGYILFNLYLFIVCIAILSIYIYNEVNK